jgi:hypothetical protein
VAGPLWVSAGSRLIQAPYIAGVAPSLLTGWLPKPRLPTRSTRRQSPMDGHRDQTIPSCSLVGTGFLVMAELRHSREPTGPDYEAFVPSPQAWRAEPGTDLPGGAVGCWHGHRPESPRLTRDRRSTSTRRAGDSASDDAGGPLPRPDHRAGARDARLHRQRSGVAANVGGATRRLRANTPTLAAEAGGGVVCPVMWTSVSPDARSSQSAAPSLPGSGCPR